MKKVTVIINPVSCADGVEKIREQMLPRFALHKCVPNFVETVETPPATTLARAALDAGSDLVIAAGGDGTIMQTANALIGTKVPLGIIPMGTGNLLALNLNLPTNIDDAIDVAMGDTVRHVDLIKVNGGEHYFAIMGGIGFDAHIMDNTDRLSKQRFGWLAYVWTAIQNLEGDLFEATVRIDSNEEIVEKVKSILIANMGLIGPNFNAFPEARPDDGYLRVGLLKAASAPEFLHLMATTMTEGTPTPDPAFDVYSCKTVDIRLTEPQLYEYDGDIQGKVTGLFAEVVPRALKIMSPRTE